MEENRVTQGLPVTRTRTHLASGSQQHGTRLETNRLNQRVGPQLQAVGARVIRYGLVLVLAWIGFMKFTGYEAAGIQPLVASSPLFGWMYSILSVRQFSTGLGVLEVTIAALIALRPWFPKASAAGSGAAVIFFLTTISFLFSAPGWEPSLGGFPALSASVGQFLIKDVVLLGAAIWTCGEACTLTNSGQEILKKEEYPSAED